MDQFTPVQPFCLGSKWTKKRESYNKQIKIKREQVQTAAAELVPYAYAKANVSLLARLQKLPTATLTRGSLLAGSDDLIFLSFAATRACEQSARGTNHHSQLVELSITCAPALNNSAPALRSTQISLCSATSCKQLWDASLLPARLFPHMAS